MAKYISTDTANEIMSAVESDETIAFFVEDGQCIVYFSNTIASGSDEFEEWFRSEDAKPSMDNAPDGIIAVIPYEPVEV